MHFGLWTLDCRRLRRFQINHPLQPNISVDTAGRDLRATVADSSGVVAAACLVDNNIRKFGSNRAVHSAGFQVGIHVLTQAHLDVAIDAADVDGLAQSSQSKRDLTVYATEISGAAGLGNFNTTINAADIDRPVNFPYFQRAIYAAGVEGICFGRRRVTFSLGFDPKILPRKLPSFSPLMVRLSAV